MSHIQYISIKNYRGIKNELKLQLSPISILIGPNNSGKSTVLRSIHILKIIKHLIKTEGIQGTYQLEHSTQKEIRLSDFQELKNTEFKFPYKMLGLTDIFECHIKVSSVGIASIKLDEIGLYEKDVAIFNFLNTSTIKNKNHFSIGINFLKLISLYNKSNRLYRHSKRHLDELNNIIKDYEFRTFNSDTIFKKLAYKSRNYITNINTNIDDIDFKRFIHKVTKDPINEEMIKRIQALKKKITEFPLIETYFPLGSDVFDINEETYLTYLYPGFEYNKPSRVFHLDRYSTKKLDARNFISLVELYRTTRSKEDIIEDKLDTLDSLTSDLIKDLSKIITVNATLNKSLYSIALKENKKFYNLLLYKFLSQIQSKYIPSPAKEYVHYARYSIYQNAFKSSHTFINNFLLPNLNSFHKLRTDYDESGYIPNDREYLDKSENETSTIKDFLSKDYNNLTESIIEQLDILGIKFNKDVYSNKLKENFNNTIKSIGYGERKIIPILISVAYFNYIKGLKGYKLNNAEHIPFTLLIEEPESNLHPNAQSRLANFFVQLWKSKNTQSIIETHSEYFVRKLQFLVAKELISNDHISIFYFDINSIDEEGINPFEITLNSHGELNREFGSGFFDETVNLSFEYYRLKNELRN